MSGWIKFLFLSLLAGLFLTQFTAAQTPPRLTPIATFGEGVYPQWSPNGDYIAVGNWPEDEKPSPVRIFGRDGQLLFTIPDGWLLSWSPDSQFVAVESDKEWSSNEPFELQLWDVASRQIILRFQDETLKIVGHRWIAPDRFWLLSWDGGLKTLSIWEVDDDGLRLVHAIVLNWEFNTEPWQIEWSPDNAFALVAHHSSGTTSYDKAHLVDMQAGQEIAILDYPFFGTPEPYWIGNHATLAIAFKNGDIWWWDLHQNERQVFHLNRIDAWGERPLMQVDPERRFHVVTYKTSVAGKLDAATYRFDALTQETTYLGETITRRLSPKGNILAFNTIENPHSVRLFDISTLTLLRQVEMDTPVNFLQWSPDGRFLLIGTRLEAKEELHVFHFTPQTLSVVEIGSITETEVYGLWDVHWSPDGRLMLSGVYYYSHEVDLWELPEG